MAPIGTGVAAVGLGLPTRAPDRSHGPVGALLWCWVLIAAVGAAVTACQSPAAQRPAPSAPTDSVAVAYTSAHDLGVVTGTNVTARAPGDFRHAAARFTDDGRFVFATAGIGNGTPPQNERLAYIDTHDGRANAVPLAGRPVPGGGSTVVWWEHPDRLMRLDLGAPASEPELLQTVRLPEPESPGAPQAVAGVQVLGVGREATLLARVECPCGSGGEHTHLYRLGRDRTVRPLGEPAMGSTVSAGVNADGTAVAYAVNGRSGATCGVSTVVRVGLADGTVTKSRVHAEDGCSTITHLWWDGSESLLAGYAGHDAFGSRPGVPGVWEQTADRWQQVDAGPVLQRLHLAAEVDAVLVPDATRPNVGTLYIEETGRRSTIADAVTAIAMPPRRTG